MFLGICVKYLCSCPVLMDLNLHDRFAKNTRILNVMKIRPVGAELFHADRQTYDEASSHFFGILQTRVKLLVQPYHTITCTHASRDPLHFSSNVGHRLLLDTSASLHRTFKSESLADVSFFLVYNSADQPSFGVFRSINFPRSSTKTCNHWTDTVILLFSERSSLRCIVQPDGGSWHPQYVMNNSTEKRSTYPLILSRPYHITLWERNRGTRWMWGMVSSRASGAILEKSFLPHLGV
jgi:hypothetical protein